MLCLNTFRCVGSFGVGDTARLKAFSDTTLRHMVMIGISNLCVYVVPLRKACDYHFDYWMLAESSQESEEQNQTLPEDTLEVIRGVRCLQNR